MTPPELRAVPDGLMQAFAAYERALMDDDLDAMDRLFTPGAATLRGDAAGLVVGHDAIAEFRRGRGGAPQRTVLETQVQVIDDDHALIVAVTELARGGRGLQTQAWVRGVDGWRVSAAHVSVPAPALDTRIWRIVGDPLLPATAPGPLTGESVAVKDLYAVAGFRVGAGNPTWLATSAIEPTTAPVVQALLDAGADVRGIARTDEFAYSLAGTNAHHGAPPNPKAPGRIPGGSSSGSASAVSLGHADIGLGTDTGGSIRVPAAYQGLFGLRTTHDLVDRTGLLPLAPSFDTVGWLTRDAETLWSTGDVLLPTAPGRPLGDLVVVPELLALSAGEVAAAVGAFAAEVGARPEHWDLADLDTWREAFVTWQAFQAWQCHGDWLAGRLDTLGADVRARFEMASQVGAPQAQAAYVMVQQARAEIRERVGDRAVLLPSAATIAPGRGDDVQAARDATLRLTCLSGLGGLPAVAVPLQTATGPPCGVSVLAAAGRDRDLLDWAWTARGGDGPAVRTKGER